MFDVSASELLLTVIVAVVVIGPKDLPLALRTAGKWMGKVRRVSNHFRSGIETMIREAELEEMEAKWREQNAAIMAAHPETVPEPVPEPVTEPAQVAGLVTQVASLAEPEPKREAAPELPLAPPR